MLVTALTLAAIIGCAVVWAALGRGVWWVPAFALSFMGGNLDVGFKVYPHEIGIVLSLIALAARVVFDAPRRRRRPLDWSFHVLVIYMLAHMAVSCGLSLAAGMPGTATIARLYVNGLWGAIFAATFWVYGSLRHLRLGLLLATLFCLLRAAMAVARLEVSAPAAAASGALFVAPIGVDLRVSAMLLITLLIIWFYRHREPWLRVLFIGGFALGIYLTWIGGSRVAALSAVLTGLLWAAVQRRRAGLGAGAVLLVTAATAFVAVNASEGLYDQLPAGARRSLSAFVITRDLPVRADTDVSDVYHALLLESGLRRWTHTPGAFLVGNPVEGWDPDYGSAVELEDRADIAVRLSTYESAAITISATLGLVGLLLWGRVLFWLYRPFTGDLLRRGIRHQDDALVFVAVQSLFMYLGFSWIAGGYPSAQCVIGVLAAVSFHDRRRAEAS